MVYEVICNNLLSAAYHVPIAAAAAEQESRDQESHMLSDTAAVIRYYKI